MAKALLYGRSGRQFGCCEVTLRPCNSGCGCGSAELGTYGSYYYGNGHGAMWGPLQLASGQWINTYCPCAGDSCGCCSMEELRLPGPVQDVNEVLIDGNVLAPTAYVVNNHKYVARIDGSAWPTCQDLNAPSTDPNTFQITYTRGIPLDAFGLAAYKELSCEFLKAMVNADGCRLPQNLQTVSRQGVTLRVSEDVAKGEIIGIPLVEQWLTMVNPYKAARRAAVFSPDRPRIRWQTSP
jgi:hypothetical protein